DGDISGFRAADSRRAVPRYPTFLPRHEIRANHVTVSVFVLHFVGLARPATCHRLPRVDITYDSRNGATMPSSLVLPVPEKVGTPASSRYVRPPQADVLSGPTGPPPGAVWLVLASALGTWLACARLAPDAVFGG